MTIFTMIRLLKQTFHRSRGRVSRPFLSGPNLRPIIILARVHPWDSPAPPGKRAQSISHSLRLHPRDRPASQASVRPLALHDLAGTTRPSRPVLRLNVRQIFRLPAALSASRVFPGPAAPRMPVPLRPLIPLRPGRGTIHKVATPARPGVRPHSNSQAQVLLPGIRPSRLAPVPPPGVRLRRPRHLALLPGISRRTALYQTGTINHPSRPHRRKSAAWD
jgi:hypothetical protein